MKYIGIKEAAAKWGVSERRVRLMCSEGRIEGAIKLGWSWTIPSDTPKPRDGRELRRYKNLNIRPGTVDVDKLSRLSSENPITKEFVDGKEFETIVRRSLSALLSMSGYSVRDSDIKAVCAGKIVPSLSLEMHLIIVNFRSIMRSFASHKEPWVIEMHLIIVNFRSIMRSFASHKEPWVIKDMKAVYSRLMQGIDDGAGEFREGFTRFTVRGEEHIRVAAQMEATLMQYELSWRHLHGLIASSILYAEMLRIEPYEDYTELFSYLMLSGELMRHGILPPLLEKDMADEEKAAFSLAIGRGNYADFTAFIERAVESSYREAGHV